MINFKIEIALILCCFFIKSTIEHGSMIEPPSRTNAWLYDKDFMVCCTFYDYNQMNCGGQNKLWTVNNGRCGICGESWDEPKNFEKGGKKYIGKIVRTYQKESVINVTIQLTANHKGFFEFRLCNIDGWENDATEACLNKTLLKTENTQEERVHINTNENMVLLSYNLKLPQGFTCNHCVLQWHWVTANYWGKSDNRECLGCGMYQEHTNGCADIAIKDQSLLNNLQTTTRSSSSNGFTFKQVSKLSTTLSTSTSTTTTTKTTTGTTTYETTSTSPTISMITTQGCQAKLEFGESNPIVRAAVVKFCENICHLKCLDLINDYERDLYSNSESQPTADLLTCLDTCPVLCTCHTARIP